MKKQKTPSPNGFVLIEALVAILVVMIGTLGLIKVNAVLLGGTGVTKTQTEALQLAQQRIEAARNYALATGCTEGSTNTSHTGTNANFRIDTVVSAGTVGSDKVIQACVAWDGSNNACNAAADKRVILKSSIACTGTGSSGLVAESNSESTGVKLKTPTGVARVGGRASPTCPDGDCAITIAAPTGAAGDNLKIYTTGTRVELVDVASSQVLLTIDDGSAFSTISGRVYIQTDSGGNPIVDPRGNNLDDPADDNVFVLSSDASYCARVFPTVAVPSAGAKYRYFDYNCYVSKGWWGNIGVVRLDNPNTSNRVCLGDMGVSSAETSIWSRKAALSISRAYRAYQKIDLAGDDTDLTNFKTIGIGFAQQDDGSFSTVYAPVNLGNPSNRSNEYHHDFLITTITGTATCEGSGNMKLLSTDTGTNNLFTGNLGAFQCLSGQCPGLAVASAQQTTTISGVVTKGVGAALTGIDPADCQETPSWGTNSAGNYTYSCVKKWNGFAGSSWQGGVTFLKASGNTTTICPNSANSLPTVTPGTSSVASTVNDSFALSYPNTITFTDVPLQVTGIVINLNAEASTCARLGTPDIRWSTGQQPHDLIWNAIVGANSYNVYSCSVNTSSSCEPSTLLSPSPTARSVSPFGGTLIAAGDTTKCYQAVAVDSTGGATASLASAIKCMTQTVTLGNNGSFRASYSER